VKVVKKVISIIALFYRYEFVASEEFEKNDVCLQGGE
jgi:hypothetical protein